MEYRGIQYEIRASIVRGELKIAVYFEGDQPTERTFKGSRPDAEARARAMIDSFLKRGEIPRKRRARVNKQAGLKLRDTLP